MQTNSFNNMQSLKNDPTLSTRFVPTDSAPNARGFAQIMQAFATDSESSAAQQIADGQDADKAEDKASEQGNSADESNESESVATDSSSADDLGSTSDTDEQGASSEQVDADGSTKKIDHPLEQSSDGAIDEQAAALVAEQLVSTHQPGTPNGPAGSQAVQAQEASMRLLENQSEQAKLSIKSLVRSLIHTSGADATTIAVDAKLGRIEHPGAGAQSGQIAPDQSRSDQSVLPRVAFALQDGVGSNLNQPSVDASGVQPGVIRFDPTPPILSTTLISPPDHASRQGGQQGAQRVDVASVVSQALSGTLPTQPIRGSANQSAGQVSGVANGQSLQAIRAVSSIDASQGGQVGNQQANSNPGSLVERMKSSEMPSETKRAEVLAQVQRGLASLLRSGKGEMTLKLTPGHLGEVRIRINPGGSGLGIRFETSSNEATELLSRSIKELGLSLQSKGIKLDQIQVEHTPSPNTSTPDSSSRLDGDLMQGHADQSGSEHHPHRDQTEHPGEDPEDQTPHKHPETIWTELGLDAIA